MKALVTGPDGLLGSNFVRALVEKKFEVRALVHPSSKSSTLDGLHIERVAGDLLDPLSVRKAARGCEVVFHVAASTALWPPLDPKITSVNVRGTRNVLDAAERAGARRLVHVGSASSFGYGTKDKPGTEESPYKYENFGLAYYDSKRAAQRMVLRHAREGRMDAVVVNPTFMFGPWDAAPSSGELIKQFVKMKLPAYPPGGRNFAHARDVARGMIAAFEKGKTGECYILGGENLEMHELFEIIADVAGIKPPRFAIPDAAVLAAGALGSAYGTVTNRRPRITMEMARNSCIGSYYSPKKAVTELGLPQTPVREAVEDSYRWMRDNGVL